MLAFWMKSLFTKKMELTTEGIGLLINSKNIEEDVVIDYVKTAGEFEDWKEVGNATVVIYDSSFDSKLVRCINLIKNISIDKF